MAGFTYAAICLGLQFGTGFSCTMARVSVVVGELAGAFAACVALGAGACQVCVVDAVVVWPGVAFSSRQFPRNR